MPLASSSSGECVFSVRLEAMFLTMFDLPPVGVTPRSPVRSCVFKFSAGSCVDPLGVFVSIYGGSGQTGWCAHVICHYLRSLFLTSTKARFKMAKAEREEGLA